MPTTKQPVSYISHRNIDPPKNVWIAVARDSPETSMLQKQGDHFWLVACLKKADAVRYCEKYPELLAMPKKVSLHEALRRALDPAVDVFTKGIALMLDVREGLSEELADFLELDMPPLTPTRWFNKEREEQDAASSWRSA